MNPTDNLANVRGGAVQICLGNGDLLVLEVVDDVCATQKIVAEDDGAVGWQQYDLTESKA